ncbi:hypothetical protein [Muriicola marianensis]|uniref:Uncharacterized protein n=1 Tax=Muriicola marianensis TaxID=1324801 RepID=A0ABQ1QZL6_9FLAO|nr:hypothetical protein [Muriicola marianensis]GGD51243.1 hypothetical protein GCM10011361_17460 [Muriicola marianensis]
MELSKNRSFLVLFVSALWLLSITAPPILQLLDENSPGITYTLNEEESKEQEKKDPLEETKFIDSQDLSHIQKPYYADKSGWKNTLASGAIYMEIPFPPPESLS